MSKIKSIILWMSTIILLLFAITGFSSKWLLSGCLFLMSAIVCSPIFYKKIAENQKNQGIKKFIAPFVILTFIIGFASVPTSSTSEDIKANASVIPVAEKDISVSDQNISKDITKTSQPTSEMKVHFIDVGQADSILIQSSEHNMLIDAGNNDDDDLVVQYLNDNNVQKLDYVIGTHPHEDHIGGLDTVIKTFDVETVIMPEKEHTTQTYEDVLDAIIEKNLKITKPVVGTSYDIGDAKFTIIAPNDVYGDDLNNWSVGIKLINGDNAFVMCGDAEIDAENDICNNNIDISADVLKLGHHGSNTATSADFLHKVNPTAVIISCGKDNTYGHPHQQTLEEIKNLEVHRTDKEGTIIATSDGTNIIWNTIPTLDLNEESIGEENPSGVVPEPNLEVNPEPMQQESNTEVTYVLNTSSKKFHEPTCSRLPTKNREDTTMSREEIINNGYSPCKICNP